MQKGGPVRAAQSRGKTLALLTHLILYKRATCRYNAA
jgi:hypothetical protein